MDYIVKSTSLTKSYGKNKILNNLSINIPSGSIYGLVGKNGVGKTTLIRIITGLQSPTSGSYEIYGVSYKDKNIYNSRKRIGAIVETPAFYLDMSAENNLKQQCLILGLPSYESIGELLKLVGLQDTGKKRVRNFSLGMKNRLGIAMALVGNPDFLVLDEPTNGLDPQGIIEIRELLLKLNKEKNITILISSHILDELSRFATHYGFLDNGQIIKEISAKELEETCRKCIKVKVSDTKILARVLESKNIEFEIVSDDTAKIFGKINLTSLVKSLSKENCEIISSESQDESLENYFINLIGGNKND